MKKLILFSIMCLLLLTSVSAGWEFDNVGKYDEQTQTITIKNSILGIPFLDLGTIAEIQLTSPLSIALPLGYHNFANITIRGFEDYNSFLTSMDFYDKKINSNKFDSENKIERNFDIMIRGMKEVTRNRYGSVPVVAGNGSTIYEYKVIGTYTEEVIVFNELTEKDIKQGETLDLELWIVVENADNVEWVAEFMGVPIFEWAEFSATGGDITFDGDFEIHTFTTNGTFTVTGTGFADVLVVAGGGGGPQQGGGAGAGGYILFEEFTLTEQAYAVTVGTGGTGGVANNVPGSHGANSVFDNLTMIGGSGGTARLGVASPTGGSGGGDSGSGPGPSAGTAGQGFAGGDGFDTPVFSGGGGGGASEVGFVGTNGVGGNGGDGLSNTIFNGTTLFYAGGGGGNINNAATGTPGSGGLGGGGKGGSLAGGGGGSTCAVGVDGLGGGGGGASEANPGCDGGNGIVIIRFLPIPSGPIITLNKPDNSTVFEIATINMNCTVSDDINLINVSLILDGVISETNSSGINNSLYNFEKVLSGGDHNWTCRAANNESEVVTAGTRFFNINASVGTELISPINNQNFTTTSIVNLVFNSTPTNQDLVFGNTTIWFSNGTLAVENSTSLSGTDEVQTNITNSLIEESYIWGASTTGTITTNTTINRTFIVHTTPSSIAITFPTGNIDSFALGDNLSLNWSISEPGQNLSEHITNCSFTYNSVEIFFNLTQCIEINSTTFLYVNGVNNLSFKVQEEFGFNTTNTTSWTFSVIEINQTFSNETIEGSLEDFEAQIELGGSLSISAAALIYNGTTNVGSSSTSGGITTLTATNVLVSAVTANTNLSFVWSLILSDSSQINLTIKNQTVLNLGVDNCGVFTNRIFNFTSVDEKEQTILVNTTQEIAVNIFSSDRNELILNLSDEYTSNPTLICLNINLTNSTIYSVDVIVRYSSEDPDHAIEYFNIVDLELTNDTEEQVITLFDLNLSDSTEFQLTFTGQDFLPVENALVFIERQYIAENVFKTVELPKTDSNGQTVLHLVRNDVLYNIVVVKDNIVLGSFSNLIAFCDDFTIGDCKISLNAIGEETGVFNYDEGVGILYDSQPVYNASTFLVSFDFISSDGESKIVTLNVERRDVFGNTSICSSTVISVGGTVFCNTGNVTDATLFTSIFVDEEEWINSQVSVDTSTYGSIGYVALFFISLLLILAFGDSKNGTIFALLIGYLIAITMGWMVGGIIGPTSSGVWIIVLTIVAIYQINKHRVT